MMWVSISVEHNGEKIGISANVESEPSGWWVGDLKFSDRHGEMVEYFRRHPTRLWNIREDLISKAIKKGVP